MRIGGGRGERTLTPNYANKTTMTTIQNQNNAPTFSTAYR